MKVKYDYEMRRFTKITDKYYRTGASRWIRARLLCPSIAVAERKFGLAPGSLNKYFYEEPWDDVMGYRKT